jgi:hypothetical protein
MSVQNYLGVYDYSEARINFLPLNGKVRESPLTTLTATVTVKQNKAGLTMPTYDKNGR